MEMTNRVSVVRVFFQYIFHRVMLIKTLHAALLAIFRDKGTRQSERTIDSEGLPGCAPDGLNEESMTHENVASFASMFLRGLSTPLSVVFLRPSSSVGWYLYLCFAIDLCECAAGSN